MPRKTTGSPVQRASAAHARAVMHGRAAEEVAAARGAFVTEKIADYIERQLEEAPPLTADQRSRLARLLTADGGAA